MIYTLHARYASNITTCIAPNSTDDTVSLTADQLYRARKRMRLISGDWITHVTDVNNNRYNIKETQ